MEDAIQEWVKISEYDLKTAEAMLETERYLYVAFMCQQAIEKILKAIYCQRKNELPPRTHNGTVAKYIKTVIPAKAGIQKPKCSSKKNFWILRSSRRMTAWRHFATVPIIGA